MRKRQPPIMTMPTMLSDRLLLLMRLAVPTIPLPLLHLRRPLLPLPLMVPDLHNILTLQLPI